MNLVLLEKRDFTGNGLVRLTGGRLRHIAAVLRAGEGDELAVGVLGGRTGSGRIVSMSGEALEMEVRAEREPPAPLPITVVLALPRPKVMRRVLLSLTVLGVKRIVLLNTARVEKSYWQTPFLGAEAVRRQLILGLEQAGDTVLPEVLLEPLFRPFVEDELPAVMRGTAGFVAHPGEASSPPWTGGPATLVIGPEGGFVPFELEKLVSLGCSPLSLGPRKLNVEAAVPALIARLL